MVYYISMLTDLYPEIKKDADGNMIGECPECGKEIILTSIGKVGFCSLMCETNYRYRMKNRDEYGHVSRGPDDVKEL